MRQNGNLERPWLVCALLVLAVLAVYLPTLGLAFLTFDDDYYVTRNPQVAGGLTWAGVGWAFTRFHSANWHPLTWLSHMLDCQLYGLNPAGHHLTNLLVHAANSVLLFLWLRSLTRAYWRSAFVAALFALHPLHVESVAWVAERKDVLCAFFGLLSLWAYTRYAGGKSEGRNPKPEGNPKAEIRRDGSQSTTAAAPHHASRITHQPPNSDLRSSNFYLLSLLFFALGLMSKPMLVTWPFVMALLDYWPLGRWAVRSPQPAVHSLNAVGGTTQHGSRVTRHADQSPIVNRQSPMLLGLLWEKLPFFALSAASCVVTVLAQRADGALAPLQTLPFGMRILNALDGYFRYVCKLVWPTDLAVIYPFGSLPAAELSAAALLLLAVTIPAWWQRSRRPYLTMGWAWYLGTLVPVIGLVQAGNQALADRYTYLPAIGLFIMAAWGGTELLSARSDRRLGRDVAARRPLRPEDGCSSKLSLPGRFGLTAAAAAVLIACALRGQAQLLHWQNSECLFRQALRVNSNNFVAWSGLGYYLAELGQVRQAEACYRAAVEINPSFAEAWNGLGCALAKLGRHDEAIGSYETALRLAPDHLTARSNLATSLAACGRLDEAKAQCRDASRVDPRAATPHSNLGALLAGEGQWEEAIAEYQMALAREPRLNEARCGLAGALGKQGRYDEALRELSGLLIAQPGYGPGRLQLGVIFSLQGNRDQAIREFTELLSANPADSAAAYHLGLALGAQGKTKEALAQYRAAVKARPDFPEALNNLAWVLATSPDPQLRDGRQAVELAERACRLTEHQQAFMAGTLAAAYAEAGRFPEAVATAEKAIALAEKAGDREVADMNRKLLGLYRLGQPYRDTP